MIILYQSENLVKAGEFIVEEEPFCILDSKRRCCCSVRSYFVSFKYKNMYNLFYFILNVYGLVEFIL